MSLHVFVVGDPTTEWMTLVHGAFDVSGSERRRIRAPDPETFIAALKALATHEKRSIDVLDILDHGSPGHQFLGLPQSSNPADRPVLFASDGDLATRLKGIDVGRIKNLLSPHGVVRLLGCEIGGTNSPTIAVSAGAAGRALVLKLAHLLGEQRQVLATLSPILPAHFDANGFRDGPAREFLFSCHGALDHGPPGDRGTNLRSLSAAGFPPP